MDGSTVYGKVYVISSDVKVENQTIGKNDFLARDLRTRDVNPAVEVMDGGRATTKEWRLAVIDVLLELETEEETNWDRSRESLEYEWWYHNSLTWVPFGIGKRGEDVMLDNNGGS